MDLLFRHKDRVLCLKSDFSDGFQILLVDLPQHRAHNILIAGIVLDDYLISRILGIAQPPHRSQIDPLLMADRSKA